MPPHAMMERVSRDKKGEGGGGGGGGGGGDLEGGANVCTGEKGGVLLPSQDKR